MKNGSKPTYAQRKVMEKHKVDTFGYLVVKMMGPKGFLLRSRDDGSYIVIYEDRKGIFAKDGITLISE